MMYRYNILSQSIVLFVILNVADRGVQRHRWIRRDVDIPRVGLVECESVGERGMCRVGVGPPQLEVVVCRTRT
jgi:hypothetical protein